MKLCEIENCKGDVLNTEEILYYDYEENKIKRFGGDDIFDLNLDINSINIKLTALEDNILELDCENINEDVLKELDEFRTLITKIEVDLSECEGRNLEMYAIYQGIGDIIIEKFTDFNEIYEKFINDSEIKIQEYIAQGNEDLRRLIDQFGVKVQENITEIDQHVIDGIKDLDLKELELKNDLDLRVEVVNNRLEIVEENLDNLVENDELDSAINTLNKSVDDKITYIDDKFTEFETEINDLSGDVEQTSLDVVNREIKSQIVDKLSTVGGKNLLSGGDVTLNRSWYVDLVSRGNISSEIAARTIAYSVIPEKDGDIVYLRWQNAIRYGWGYWYRYTTKVYSRKYLVTSSGWRSV
jgi:hypothetical protein